MGTIRVLALQPGREPAEIELDGNVDSINFFIFRNSEPLAIVWIQLEDGLDLVFAETTEERKEGLQANRYIDWMDLDIHGQALMIRYRPDDETVFMDVTDADLEKYRQVFSLESSRPE